MTRDFLLSVLSPPLENETYYTLGLQKSSRPDVAKCATVDDIIDRGEMYTRFGLDAYFALGTFGSEDGRKASNARRLRSLWVDLDVGKPQNSYPSVEQALAGLLKFSQDNDFTPSYIVFSGKGIHAYWVMEQDLPVQQWAVLAAAFRTMCQQQGLIIDPACTADAARVLRIPGTVHMSTGNEVRILRASETRWGVARIAEKLAPYAAATPAPETPPSAPPVSVPDATAELFGMGPEPPKAHAEPIVRGCAQMLTMGLCSEPQWYLAMNVLARCVDGHEWVHKLSAMDTERYNVAATDAKFSRAKVDSPTTCAKFEQHHAKLCQQCVYRGKLRSPIELHKYAPPEQEPQPEPEPAPQGNALHIPKDFATPRVAFVPTPGANFRVDAAGIHYIRAVKNKESGDWEDEDIIICRTQLYFKRTDIVYDDKEWQTDYVFDAVYPDTGGQKELHMMVQAFHASPDKWMADHLIHLTNLSHRSVFMAFVNAYLEQVVHRSPVRHKYSHYGWTEVKDAATGEKSMGYVTEGCVITASGVQPASFDRLSSDPTRHVFTRAGTLEAWKVVPKLYRALDQPLGQLAMCFSFAAPLMKYGSGEAKNCLLNIYSRDGGRGKSHVLRMAASVWGNPAKAFFQKDSSVVAREKRLALWHNMPAMMDEISHLSDEDMTNLVFAIITGEEKQKLSQNSEFRITGTWSTCTFATSNRPVKEFVARRYADSDAGALRVMDYECDFAILPPQSAQMQCLTHCVAVMQQNYGLAGPEFIYQLLQRPERLHVLESTVSRWVMQKQFEAKERFYSYPLGLALQAGRWAVEFGLLDYDMDALERWVFAKFLPNIREFDAEIASNPQEVLLGYIHDRILRSALIVRRDARNSNEPEIEDSTVPDPYIARRPTATLAMRYELENEHLYFSQRDFTEWCKTCGWSPRTVFKELKAAGYITNHRARMSLAKYVRWLPADRVYCVSMDAEALRKCGVDVNKTFTV